MLGLPRPNTAAPRRKHSPRETRGFCIVRLFDEQLDVRLLGFSYRQAPPRASQENSTAVRCCESWYDKF